ncbi:MAG TPA: hypothetical protein VGJ33_12505 [Candidatus Angelobacter sp.]|jgi:hypothetical protein
MRKNRLLIYLRAFLVVVLAFALANRIDLHRRRPCCDFIYTRGVPFAFLREGGFQGLHQILLLGVAVDIVTVFGVAALLGWAWNRKLVK